MIKLEIPAKTGKKLTTAVNSLVEKGDRILIGLSGGPDSVFLTCFLYGIALRYGLKLYAGHLNYKLRGEESDLDETYCRDLADELELPLEVKISDLSGLKKSGGNIQSSAREERMLFFQNLAEKIDCRKIALGHTADDQAETVLGNIFRGCGMAGLSGIMPRSDKIIRPLLGISKAEIVSILDNSNIPFRVDSSNLACDYTRNKIRNLVLPQLRELVNPKIEDSLLRLSGLAREISDYMERKAAEFLAVHTQYSNLGSLIIPLDKFTGLDKILKLYLIRSALGIVLGTSRDISGFDLLESALASEKAETGYRADLGGGVFIEKASQSLIIFRPAPGFNQQAVEIPGKTVLSKFNLVLHSKTESLPVEFASPSDNREIYLDADKLRGDLFVRQYREGDCFLPLGMTGFKKMSDFFVDKKIPRALRQETPLLICEGKIVWVIGEAVSELFRIDRGTRRPMKLWVEKVVKNDE